METKKQKIEGLKEQLKAIKENIRDLNKELKLHRILKKEVKQELKELEDGNN